jgi:RimJ/RimL family protein N-acetyltransferase
MKFDLQPILENDIVVLRPLEETDFDALYAVASDPLIWAQHPAKERSQREGFSTFFNEAMHTKSAFVALDKQTNTIIGSTRYFPVLESENAIEIGWTFIARAFWGGRHNQAMKKLMLDYAFQYIDHVLFHIHADNLRSQKAVEKIGGVRVTELDGQTLSTRAPQTVIYKLSKKA